ncbi:uncharacterized protein LOC126773928 [Nymphalis io]|uniref:uncharacterized protein LOC126773928 n=1 Tax=Inachis io TaxID=171585 RepID=UPI0021686CB7|nr:uncharacterized protein LOC126773928 [Nymphalis io]
MCYVCNCFGWTLDLFQRALTFCLSCWLAYAVCCGLLIASMAGIAYGYNYCVAEFVTFTRNDVKVYMRRGQFNDKPSIFQPKRRMGDDEDDFPINLIDDYKQEVQSNDEAAMSNKWMQDQDTRKYAERLTKYLERPKTLIETNEQSISSKEPNNILPILPTQHLLVTYPTVSTTLWQSGSREILRKMFDPVLRPIVTDSDKESYYDNKVQRALGSVLTKLKTTEEEDAGAIDESLGIRLRKEDNPKSEPINIRHWKTTSKPKNLDYSTDVDEEIIYKSI